MRFKWMLGMAGFFVCLVLAVAGCGGGGGTSGVSTVASAGTLAFTASAISISQSAGNVTLTVSRTGGSAGAVSVQYATHDGTAVAGAQYTATSGTLSWADGDATSKTLSVAIAAAPGFDGSRTFNVGLSAVTGTADLGSPATAVVTIAGSGASLGFGLKVQGNQLINAQGQVVQLRGVNFSGYESVAIQGWDPADPSGGVSMGGQANGPNLDAIKSWGANTLRLPLNEDSWLGLSCYESNSIAGQPKKADPGGNYQAAVLAQVAAANTAGLYVILDLHWAAPNWPNDYWGAGTGTPAICPEMQTQMADMDHAIDFWTSIAQAFKANPAVVFELYNEPYIYDLQSGTDWAAIMQGGTFTSIQSRSSDCTQPVPSNCPWWLNVSENWQAAGMQQMLNAVRTAGATNVVLVGGDGYSSDLSQWLASMPVDSIHQLGAAWHPYPPEEKVNAVAITAQGLGYNVGDVLTFPGGDGIYSPAVVTVTAIASGGRITAVSITDPGDYLNTAAPTGAISPSSTTGIGHGASLTVGQWWGLTEQWGVPANWPVVQAIAAQVPVVISEVGDHCPTGATSAPWLQQLLPWADANGISYLGWTWDLWSQDSNVLIKDGSGTPTDGYGVYFKAHLQGMQ